MERGSVGQTFLSALCDARRQECPRHIGAASAEARQRRAKPSRLALLPQAAQLSGHRYALHGAHLIHQQHAVKVVALVLDGTGQ